MIRPAGCVAWRPIPGWVGIYEISDTGLVRRIAPGPGATVGRILVPAFNRDGYAHVTFQAHRYREYKRVHRLVAEAFLGAPVSPRSEVNHINNNRRDNRAINLEWVTRKENAQHCKISGRQTDTTGEKNGFSILSDDEAAEILSLKGRLSQSIIAGLYGVHRCTVSDIHRSISWKHLAAPGAGS